ncbi:MAG: helix-turn-helix transcriptional regulator [Candidatus Thiodiazotropha sp.]
MQIRAARALADWSQTELAERSNTSLSTIADIEAGRRGGGAATLSAIQKAFMQDGVIFTEYGVEKRPANIQIVEGENWWLRVLDDVYYTLLDQSDAEVLILCGDERESPPDVIKMWKKIRNQGTTMRQIVREDNTYLMGSVNEYRWMPKEYFENYVTMIYGEKVCVCAEDNTKAMIFKDEQLAKTWGNTFNLLWKEMEKPNESTATERF